MSSEWTTLTVAELEREQSLLVQDGNHGAYRPRKEEKVTSGIPHVRAADIRENGSIDFAGAEQLDESAWQRIKKGRAQGGDVLLTHKGTVGRVARVPEDASRFLCSPQTTFWRSLRRDAVDPRYLHCFLRSPRFVGQIRRLMHESDMAPYVSLTNQRGLLIDLPPIAEQHAIASVLGTFDDKIESNGRLADALKNLLMIAAPDNGDQSSLDAIAQFKNGGALTKHATGTGRPILRIKELKGGVNSETPRTEIDVRADHEVSNGDLLFSWSGTLLTHRWSGPDSVLNQHIFRVDPAAGFPRWFVEAWIERHLADFRAIAADKATTMGHIQRRHLTEAQVPVPKEETMFELRTLYDPLDDQRMTILREAGTLTAIRDALLPKLVSGQIRVPLSDDPEEQVGATTDSPKTAGSHPEQPHSQDQADRETRSSIA